MTDLYIGKKRSYVYANIAIQQLATEPEVIFKARGRSILTAIDAFEILKREVDHKRSWSISYKMDSFSSEMERKEKDSERGNKINISELEIKITRLD